jgi:hypothetical protein
VNNNIITETHKDVKKIELLYNSSKLGLIFIQKLSLKETESLIQAISTNDGTLLVLIKP